MLQMRKVIESNVSKHPFNKTLALAAFNTETMPEYAKLALEHQSSTYQRTDVLSDKTAWPTSTMMHATNVQLAKPELPTTLPLNHAKAITQLADVIKNSMEVDVFSAQLVSWLTISKKDVKSHNRTAITRISFSSVKTNVIYANHAQLDRFTIVYPGHASTSKSKSHNVPATKSTTR